MKTKQTKPINTLNNIDAFTRFDQSKGASIEHLYWIAGSIEHHDLKHFLEYDIDPARFVKLFPETKKDYKYYAKDKDLIQALVDNNKFGFLAEVHIKIPKNIRYENGIPTAWTTGGSSRVAVCYGETREELLSNIEVEAEKVFDQEMKREQKAKTEQIKKSSTSK